MRAEDSQAAGGSAGDPSGREPGPQPGPQPDREQGTHRGPVRRLLDGARAWRNGLRKVPTADLVYRVVVGVIGVAIVLLGLFLVPLPGPGWLIVFAGLAVLATEFEPADRLYRFVRHQVTSWTHWLARQSLSVRIAAGLLGLVLVVLVLYLSLLVVGVPGWIPGALVAWMPGLDG